MKMKLFRLLAAVIAPLILITSSVSAEETGKHQNTCLSYLVSQT